MLKFAAFYFRGRGRGRWLAVEICCYFEGRMMGEAGKRAGTGRVK